MLFSWHPKRMQDLCLAKDVIKRLTGCLLRGKKGVSESYFVYLVCLTKNHLMSSKI